MLKEYLILSTAFVFFVKSSQGNCPETELYCFNSNDDRIGVIKVKQCWKWIRFSCQPCNYEYVITSMERKISFHKYLKLCQIDYPTTVKILDTKHLWATNYWIAKNEQFNGK